MLQELKCVESDFPHLEFSGLGYHASIVGQKTYNGVAILSKKPAQVIATKLPGDDSDDQARYIEIKTDDDWRFISVYVPNGQEVGSEKFDYKLKFYRRLYWHLSQILQSEDKIIIGGDFNVALDDIDVFDVKTLRDQILFSNAERAALKAILNLGYTDCFRALHPTAHQYSWWDYRGGGFERNLGLRIDYIFANAYAAQRLISAKIDATPRGWDKPSDHAPVLVQVDGG